MKKKKRKWGAGAGVSCESQRLRLTAECTLVEDYAFLARGGDGDGVLLIYAI